jgi:hypothetical protein
VKRNILGIFSAKNLGFFLFPTSVFLFYPSFFPFLLCIKTSERIFKVFLIQIQKNFGKFIPIFFPRQNKFGKRVSKYLFNDKIEIRRIKKNTGVEKEKFKIWSIKPLLELGWPCKEIESEMVEK